MSHALLEAASAADAALVGNSRQYLTFALADPQALKLQAQFVGIDMDSGDTDRTMQQHAQLVHRHGFEQRRQNEKTKQGKNQQQRQCAQQDFLPPTHLSESHKLAPIKRITSRIPPGI